MLSKNLMTTLNRALSLAFERNHQYIMLEHLLLSMMNDEELISVLITSGVNIRKVRTEIENHLGTEAVYPQKQKRKIKELVPTQVVLTLVHDAVFIAHLEGNLLIESKTLLKELVTSDDSKVVEVLNKYCLPCKKILQILNSNQNQPFAKNMDSFDKQRAQAINNFDGIASLISDKSEQKEDPLEAYCYSLNKKVLESKIDKLIGRENEIIRSIDILGMRRAGNIIYVGEPGVGKTAIVEGLVYKICHNEVPWHFLGTEIYALDMSALLAGTRYRGDFEERIKSLIQEFSKRKKTILFIDEIHTLIGAGSTTGNSIDASNLLKPALSRGILRCIGATTSKEYASIFEKDKALNRRFQKVSISPPSAEETLKILEGVKQYYENHHNVYYSKNILKNAISLSERYIPDKFLPDKALYIIDEAGACCASKRAQTITKRLNVTKKEIETAVARISGSHAIMNSKQEKDLLLNLENKLAEEIYGQTEAIALLAKSVRIAKLRLNDAEKPMASYLFVGTSGVGKTELAKTLAKKLDMHLIRLDMSEYSEPHSVARLIGSPPGYTGYENGGLLTEAIRENPYSVLLCDEIEKAHFKVYQLFLQIMDYGSLKDSLGVTASFRNSILIMTSNAEPENSYALPVCGFIGETDNTASQKKTMEKSVERIFSSAFRNRLDEVIYFKQLDAYSIRALAKKITKQYSDRLKEANIHLSFDQSVEEFLLSMPWNSSAGSRQLQKIFQKHIISKVSYDILSGKYNPHEHMILGIKDGEPVYI